MTARINHRWQYVGDVNLEYGGWFWRIPKPGPLEDYVDAVEVIPCSDGGGPDNLFEITSGSVYIPRDNGKRRATLKSMGLSMDEDLTIRLELSSETISYAPGSMEWIAQLVEAFKNYWGFDGRDHIEIVQIGRRQPPRMKRGGEWNPKPDTILRSTARLKNYVKREYLR